MVLARDITDFEFDSAAAALHQLYPLREVRLTRPEFYLADRRELFTTSRGGFAVGAEPVRRPGEAPREGVSLKNGWGWLGGRNARSVHR